MHIARTFLSVAVAAEQLKIARVVTAAARECLNVIKFKFLRLIASGAQSILFLKKSVYVVLRKGAWCISFSGAIGMGRSLCDFSHLLGVFFRPSLHIVAVALRVFRPCLTLQFRSDTRMVLMIAPLAFGLALYADAVAYSANIVSPFAWVPAVCGVAAFTGLCAFRVFAAFALAEQRVASGASGTQASAGVSLDHMTISTRFAREIKAFSGRLSRLSLGHSFHRNHQPASTMFIVTQAV